MKIHQTALKTCRPNSQTRIRETIAAAYMPASRWWWDTKLLADLFDYEFADFLVPGDRRHLSSCWIDPN